MTDRSTTMDFTVTRLNTLHYLIQERLVLLKAIFEDADIPGGKNKISAASQLQHLTHLVGMAAEITESLEPALRDIARTVQGLADAGNMDRACLNAIFANYNLSLGDVAADQLFADAFGTGK